MKDNRAFTLVELLVTIAVIAVLAMLLIPVFKKAGDSAQAIQCVSNLRQCGVLALTYAGDFSGLFPVYPDEAPGNWSRYLAMKGYLGSVSYAGWGDVKQRPFTLCPSQPPVGQSSSNNASYGAALYSLAQPPLNGVQFVSSSGGFINSLRILTAPSPAKSPLLFDSVYAPTISAWPNQCHIASPLLGVWAASGAALRHRGRCHVLLMDGHVESGKPTADSLGKFSFQYAFDKDGNMVTF